MPMPGTTAAEALILLSRGSSKNPEDMQRLADLGAELELFDLSVLSPRLCPVFLTLIAFLTETTLHPAPDSNPPVVLEAQVQTAIKTAYLSFLVVSRIYEEEEIC